MEGWVCSSELTLRECLCPMTLGRGHSRAFVSGTGPEAPQGKDEGPPWMAPIALLRAGTLPTRGTFGEKEASSPHQPPKGFLDVGLGLFRKKGHDLSRKSSLAAISNASREGGGTRCQTRGPEAF